MTTKKLILVTGASSGVGKGIARKLCSHDYELVLTSRSEEKLLSIKQGYDEMGWKSHIVPCDLTKEVEVDYLYNECQKIGFVDCVISNAGVGIFSSITNMEVRDWDLQIDTNLKASFLLTRHFVEEMKRNKQGKFIFINSVAGQYGHSFSNSTAYVASKYGLKGFADSLRTELREFNIKVTSVYPGAIDTNFWNSINVEFPRDEMLSVEDLAETILHTIEAPNSSVIEDVVVRRTAGDF